MIETMYPPQNNSPHTTLTGDINASVTSITVDNSALLPSEPNVLTIGLGEDAELVLLQSKSGNILTVQRGYNGTTAKSWNSGDWVYRGITAQDVSALQNNMQEHGHGNITNDGSIGSQSGLAVFTGEDGTLQAETASSALELLGATPLPEQIDTSKSGSFTVDATALGKTYLLSNSADLTVTLPLHSVTALPVGFGFYLRRWGTGNVTIAGDGATITLNGATTSLSLGDQYTSVAAVVQVATDTWAVNGGLA